jgi:hypothetical protein
VRKLKDLPPEFSILSEYCRAKSTEPDVVVPLKIYASANSSLRKGTLSSSGSSLKACKELVADLNKSTSSAPDVLAL